MTKKSVFISIIVSVAFVAISTVIYIQFKNSLHNDLAKIICFSWFSIALVGADYASSAELNVSAIKDPSGTYRELGLIDSHAFYNVDSLYYTCSSLSDAGYDFYHQDLLDAYIEICKESEKRHKILYNLSVIITVAFLLLAVFKQNFDLYDFTIISFVFLIVGFYRTSQTFKSCKCYDFDIVSDYKSILSWHSDGSNNEWETSKFLFEKYKIILTGKENESEEIFLEMILVFLGGYIFPVFAFVHRVDVALISFTTVYLLLSLVYIFI